MVNKQICNNGNETETYLKKVNNLEWVCSVSPDFSLGPKICCENGKKLTKPNRNQKPKRERAFKNLLSMSSMKFCGHPWRNWSAVKRWWEKELPLDRSKVQRILRVWNKRRSEWIWKKHRETKVGELVGWIKKHWFCLQERRRNRSFKKWAKWFVRSHLTAN